MLSERAVIAIGVKEQGTPNKRSCLTSAPISALQFLFACASLCPAKCLVGKAAEQRPAGIKLVITTDKTTANPREDVTIHMVLSNTSKAGVALWDRLFVERDYEVHVLNVHGLEAPLTEWAAAIRRPPIKGSQILLALAPGDKIRKEEKLLKVYDMSEPGFYTIQVCRDLIGIGNIYSNKMQVEVQ